MSPDFDVTKAELFEAISHPVRIKILEALDERPMGFAELGRAVGIESGGHLSFHITKLRNLVKTNRRGDYVLTGEGKEALWTIHALQKSSREVQDSSNRTPLRHRSLVRPVIVIILIALLGLGLLAVIQNQEVALQQSQVSTQQQQIALYVSEVQPFANGQSASIVVGQSDFSSYGTPLYLRAWPVPLTPSSLGFPTQTLFDAQGNLWVVDDGGERLLEFRPPFVDGMGASLVLGARNLTTSYHTASNYSLVTGHTLGSESFFGPMGAAFDLAGDLWVADSSASRVVEYSPPFATGMSASLVIGQRNLTSRNLSTSQDGLNFPSRVAFDPKGDLWVLDSGNDRIMEFSPPFSDGMDASLVVGQKNFTTVTTESTRSGIDCGFGDLAFDSSGNLWVGDLLNGRILEFKPPFSTGMDASMVLGQPNFTASTQPTAPPPPVGGGLSAENPNPNPDFLGPLEGDTSLGFAVAFDSAGNLWASYNNRLLEFRPPFSTGMQPSLEIGQQDFTSTSWVGGQAGLNVPGHPAFDSYGNLWVPDTGNNRVLEFRAAFDSSSPTSSTYAQELGFLELISIGLLAIAVGAAGVAGVTYLANRRKQ